MREYTATIQNPADPSSTEYFEIYADDPKHAEKIAKFKVRKDYLPGMKVINIKPYVAEFTIISYA